MTKTEDWVRFLEQNLKDPEFKEETNGEISTTIDLVRQGLGVTEIRKKLGAGKKEMDLILELAHARIDIRGKFEKWDRLWMDSYLSRFSTPEAVCRYRSERITGWDVIEAGSGAGMQGIFLSQTNNKTTSIEIRPDRYRMAKLNALEYKTGDLRFLNGDIYNLSSSFDLGKDTLIFSDPARPTSEGERTMQHLIPSPRDLVAVFGKYSENFVFDLPPQMSWENIEIKGEKEYLSINGLLNRLTLYCGKLQQEEVSAVLLPSKYRISGEPRDISYPADSKIKSYIEVPDVSIDYAKLLWKLTEEFDVTASWRDARRVFFTSETVIKGFPGEQFRILSRVESHDLAKTLAAAGAGRVIPRFAIPEHEYYSLRKTWETGLEGSRDIYLFKHGDLFFLTEKVA